MSKHQKPIDITLPFEIKGYELIEEIGHGSFSTVYLGTKKETDETIAVKVINKAEMKKPEDTERLQREIDSMAFLHHDSIVKLHDFFSDENHFYLILDYCKGGDLFTIIEKSKHFRETQIAQIFKQIVSAVGYCHARGVAHRDLKPQNVLVTTFPFVKVADFGLCGYTTEDTKMKTFCGSPYYSAPECLNNIKYDGQKSDVWSLGVILFELSTGTHPWNPSNATQMIKQISKAQFTIPRGVNPALEDLIRSLLKVRPQDRLTCNQILAHPWMKLAPGGGRVTQTLPPLRARPILSIAESLDRDNQKSDSGIFSPFAGNCQITAINSEQSIPTSKDMSLRSAMVSRSRSGANLQSPAILRQRDASKTPQRSLLMRK